MSWITYGAYNLAALTISGGYLPTSGLGYLSGGVLVNVDAANPLPVTLAANPTITFASAQPVTQSGAWTVDVGNWPATQPVSLASLPALTTGTATIGKVDQGAAGASAWPVSLASLPAFASPPTVILGAGSAAIGSVAVTSAPTTAITAAALPLPSGAATEAGNLATIATNTGKIPTSPATDRTTALAPFAVRLSDGSSFLSALPVSWASAQHVIVDSASSVAVTSLPSVTVGAALPAGTNVIGHVIVDTAPTTVVTAAAGAGLALESGGHLASVDTYVQRIPAQGQALGSASMPVVLPSAQDLASILARLTSGALRAQLDFGALPGSPWKVATGTTLATAGIQIGSAGAATLRSLWIENGTGGGIIMFLADRTSTLSNGSRSTHGYSSTIANAAAGPAMPSQLNIEGGLPFSNGIWLQASSTVSTMTGIASTTIQYVAVYSQGT